MSDRMWVSFAFLLAALFTAASLMVAFAEWVEHQINKRKNRQN